MSWSPQQTAAINAVKKWFEDKNSPQVFRLFGFAGTGKTTIAKSIAKEIKGSVVFAAFTGKAALVLRTKGCYGASTIHSMIYKVDDFATGPEPSFILNPECIAGTAKLIVIDECSMVDEELGKDLESFGTKILVLGDTEQLPPPGGAGHFTSHRPDFMLTEIHRQAEDNPIIWMSREIREGRRLTAGMYGESRVMLRKHLGQKTVLGADQVLVGRNATRHSVNAKIRHLKGFESPYPMEGDRLVCLKNDKELNLFNGGIWRAERTTIPNEKGIIALPVTTTDDPLVDYPVDVEVKQEFFLGNEDSLHWKQRQGFQEFNYGYALTTHKSQGSQWSNVLVFDESGIFRDDARRWLYTAVTRAADRVTLVI